MLDDEIKKASEELEKVRKKLADLKEQKKAIDLEGDDQKLARYLHEKLCAHNHADQCGWFYEFRDKKEDWSGWAHDFYLKKARRVMSFCDQHKIKVSLALQVFEEFRK